MRQLFVSVAFAVFALVIGAPCSAQHEASWSRVAPPNHGFTVETPCSISEVDALKEYVPSGLGQEMSAVLADYPSRIVCVKDGTTFLVSIVSLPELVPPGKTLFDYIVSQLGATTPDGRPAISEISGRRAWINNQKADDVVAETGIIEASRDRVILYNVGALLLQGSSDSLSFGRFRDSIRIDGE
jgi:hypothetical protein